MLKKTISYTDFDGETRSEDFYFNLSKSELVRLEVRNDGSFTDYIERITKSELHGDIIDSFVKLIELSYGVRSEDGKRFFKGPEHLDNFRASPAYDELLFELFTDPNAAIEFSKGIAPDIEAARKQVEAAQANNKDSDDLKGRYVKKANELAEASTDGTDEKILTIKELRELSQEELARKLSSGYQIRH